MKIKRDIAIRRLDDRRYAVIVDGIVRYVGTQEQCKHRIALLARKNDRAEQDEALVRSVQLMR